MPRVLRIGPLARASSRAATGSGGVAGHPGGRLEASLREPAATATSSPGGLRCLSFSELGARAVSLPDASLSSSPPGKLPIHPVSGILPPPELTEKTPARGCQSLRGASEARTRGEHAEDTWQPGLPWRRCAFFSGSAVRGVGATENDKIAPSGGSRSLPPLSFSAVHSSHRPPFLSFSASSRPLFSPAAPTSLWLSEPSLAVRSLRSCSHQGRSTKLPPQPQFGRWPQIYSPFPLGAVNAPNTPVPRPGAGLPGAYRGSQDEGLRFSATRKMATFGQPGLWPVVPSSSGVGQSASGGLVVYRGYAKRPKKWHGDPWRFAKAEEGVPVPPKQPNEGATRGRNHKRRYEKRDIFKKVQNDTRKAQTVAARKKKAAKHFRRWRESFSRMVMGQKKAIAAANASALQ